MFEVFHSFEPIQTYFDWNYQKSLLNRFHSSKSDILAAANNQRILHHFLFGQDREFEAIDISKRPTTYFPHQASTRFSYAFGNNVMKPIRFKINLTFEWNGIIGVFEADNEAVDCFEVCKLYYPFLYYHNLNLSPKLKNQIKSIYCVYVIQEKQVRGDVFKLWAYTFDNPLDLTSIKFIKSAAYQLSPT